MIKSTPYAQHSAQTLSCSPIIVIISHIYKKLWCQQCKAKAHVIETQNQANKHFQFHCSLKWVKGRSDTKRVRVSQTIPGKQSHLTEHQPNGKRWMTVRLGPVHSNPWMWSKAFELHLLVSETDGSLVIRGDMTKFAVYHSFLGHRGFHIWRESSAITLTHDWNTLGRPKVRIIMRMEQKERK